MPINLCIKYNATAANSRSNISNDIITDNNSTDNGSKIDNVALCSSNANCEYTGPGQYECICRPGYFGDGKQCKRRS